MKYLIKNRNSSKNIIIESSKTLNFFYDSFLGRILLKIVTSRFISNLIGLYMNSKLSICKINKCIKENNIDMSEYENKKYISYNDFFTRKIIKSKRPIDNKKSSLIAPCDSKLSVYKIDNDLTLKIKGSYYDVNTLVNKKIMSEYKGGYACVFRLSVDNYHRYCYVDSGTKEKNIYIKGKFHTVQPITLKHYNFFKTNSREYTILNTDNFGKVIDIDIGALGVGRIKNHHQNYEFKKGEEKGYFEFGGSTIVLLFKKDTITIDQDILDNSKKNIETNVRYGEKIGTKLSYKKRK